MPTFLASDYWILVTSTLSLPFRTAKYLEIRVHARISLAWVDLLLWCFPAMAGQAQQNR